MATRARRKWAPDPRGYYARQIGWELSKSGKLQQHKFLLGTDRKDAESRERKLRELWDAFEKSCQELRPLWPPRSWPWPSELPKGFPTFRFPEPRTSCNINTRLVSSGCRPSTR